MAGAGNLTVADLAATVSRRRRQGRLSKAESTLVWLQWFRLVGLNNRSRTIEASQQRTTGSQKCQCLDRALNGSSTIWEADIQRL